MTFTGDLTVKRDGAGEVEKVEGTLRLRPDAHDFADLFGLPGDDTDQHSALSEILEAAIPEEIEVTEWQVDSIDECGMWLDVSVRDFEVFAITSEPDPSPPKVL